jgi:beta-ribofuranosylaminobenzene 5'-phosphate synthase
LSVRVRAGSRIHISLADMGFVSPRAFGGVGFMLDRIAADVELRRAPTMAFAGATELDEACKAELAALVASLAKAHGQPVETIVHGHALQHVGLGTKTALKLAVVSAYHRLVGAPANRAAQQRLSGRGGASGIGIHGFFAGGVLWDAGKPTEAVDALLPSGAGPATSTPVLMMRLPFPSSWRIGLCLPRAERSHGKDERRFFEANTPIPRDEALETMAQLYHGVLPAFRQVDLALLASSLAEVSRTGFKRLEIERCGSAASKLLGDLNAKGYAAGMSSMGPLVYVILAAGDETAAADDIAGMCAVHGANWLGTYRGLNRGADASQVVTV